jgi:hypothetical protein
MTRWRVGLLQILAVLASWACGYYSINSLAAKPRAKALEFVHQPIPEDWEWVVVNHGEAYPWPRSRLLTLLSLAGWAGSIAFLLFTGLRGQGWSPWGRPRKDGTRDSGLGTGDSIG